MIRPNKKGINDWMPPVSTLQAKSINRSAVLIRADDEEKQFIRENRLLTNDYYWHDGAGGYDDAEE